MMRMKRTIVLVDENGFEESTMENVGAFLTSENRMFVISPTGEAIAIFDEEMHLDDVVTEPDLPRYDEDIESFMDFLREKYLLEESEQPVSFWRDNEYTLNFMES